jgi:hypothetical protein
MDEERGMRQVVQLHILHGTSAQKKPVPARIRDIPAARRRAGGRLWLAKTFVGVNFGTKAHAQ